MYVQDTMVIKTRSTRVLYVLRWEREAARSLVFIPKRINTKSVTPRSLSGLAAARASTYQYSGYWHWLYSSFLFISLGKYHLSSSDNRVLEDYDFCKMLRFWRPRLVTYRTKSTCNEPLVVEFPTHTHGQWSLLQFLTISVRTGHLMTHFILWPVEIFLQKLWIDLRNCLENLSMLFHGIGKHQYK